MFCFWNNMRKLKISAISFLNTAPLMWDFERSTAGDDFEIHYTVPSLCADELKAGTSDIGIIPAATYASIPGLVILPDVAIAAQNAVRSILLVSKVPLEQIRTVAADTSSRTSVALLHVLFRKYWCPTFAKLTWEGGEGPTFFHGAPRSDRPASAGRSNVGFFPMPPKLDSMLHACDAALLIGDAALVVDRSKYLTWDLAEEWRNCTGKPFVFAFWAVRLASLSEMRRGLDLGRVFKASRDHGLEPSSIAQIGREWAPRLGLSEADVNSYLTENIDYDLSVQNREGLELFYEYAAECGAIPENPVLRFLGISTLISAMR
jgi:chorismate dehydratase